MKIHILAAIFVLLCGCSRSTPPKNHAVRAYPSAEAMAKWTDFSGEYVVRRITSGQYLAPHRFFLDESLMRPDAHVTIQQSGPSNMTVAYEAAYGARLATNAISVGKGTSPWTWVWDDGKAVFVESYHGQGTMMPGIVSSRHTCVVTKNDDSSLTVESTKRSGGRLLWVKTWQDPVDRSVIRLVPAKPPSTPSTEVMLQ